MKIFCRSLFFVLPLLFAFVLLAFQKDDKNFIEWSKDTPLTWKDFKATQASGAKFAALTYWSIYFTCSGESDSLKMEVICFFGKKESAVKTSARKDTSLLRHEQYHFNLAEVYTRKFRKALQENKYTFKDASDKSKKLYKQYFGECKQEQDKYDEETEHSLKTDKQKAWEGKIDKELNELEQYTWKKKSFAYSGK